MTEAQFQIALVVFAAVTTALVGWRVWLAKRRVTREDNDNDTLHRKVDDVAVRVSKMETDLLSRPRGADFNKLSNTVTESLGSIKTLGVEMNRIDEKLDLHNDAVSDRLEGMSRNLSMLVQHELGKSGGKA